MRRWIGRWIMVVGLIHSAFGLVAFRSTWSVLFAEGLFNTVNGQPEREFPFWFVAFGFVTILLGALIDSLERQHLALPSFVSWGLLILTALILVIMPISGGWLLLPAVLGALLTKRATRAS